MALSINRRTVLRGAGGATLALPALEIMGRGKKAEGAPAVPARFVLFYGGVSVGIGPAPFDSVIPKTAGTGYELTRGLAPLNDFALRSDVSVVSGLKIPWGARGNVPPAGRIESWEGTTKGPQIAGTKALDQTENPGGPTADQVVKDAIGGTVPFPSLSLRAQASFSVPQSDRGALSFGKGGRAVSPITSPRALYNTLFAAGGSVNGQSLGAAALIARRRSILDLVTSSTQRLMARLNAPDRRKVDQYFTEIRSLEAKLALLGAQPAACTPPKIPTDPPITGTSSFADDDLRAEIFCDMVHVAMACDLTRVASIMLTMSGAEVNMLRNDSAANIADAVAWHVKHFARLARKLRDTAEVDGSGMLDRSALVMVFQAGHGQDPDGDASGAAYAQGIHSAHSSENMMALVAGRAGGLRPGRHIRYSNDRHPAQVVLGAMNAVGVQGPLGEITQGLPELIS